MARTIVSPAWGNKPFEVTQDFGVMGYDPSLYPGPEYTEPLGWPAGYHIGLDIGMPTGTPIFALNPGKVQQGSEVGIAPFFRPKPVYVETKDNPETSKDESGYIEIYGHLWANRVAKGDSVVPGEQIGISGEETLPGTMTPDNTGQHLHFELRKPTPGETSSGYTAVNPESWLTQSTTDTTIPDTTPSTSEPTDTTDMPTLPSIDIAGIFHGLGIRVLLIAIGIIVLVGGVYAVTRH